MTHSTTESTRSGSSAELVDGRGGYYARIFHDEIDDGYSRIPKGRRAHAVAVHVMLAKHAGPERTAFPSIRRLEDLTGLSRPTVIDALKELGKAGLVAVQKIRTERGYRSNTYTLTRPSQVKEIYQGGKGDLPGVVKDVYPKKNHLEEEPLKNSRRAADAASPEDKVPTSADYVAMLVSGLRDRTVPLAEAAKGRFARDFKRELERGTEPETLDDALDRIIERWDDYQLSLGQAVSDLLKQNGNGSGVASRGDGANGRPQGAAQGTPQEGIANLREHENLFPYVDIAEGYDFTKSEAVPWQVKKQIGGDEAHSALIIKRIKKVVQRPRTATLGGE